jgi:HEAT repeat protein
MISEFLFHEAESTKEENTHYINLKIEIRQLIKDDFNRKILSEILLDLRKDVAGETQKRVFKLYQDLGLDNDAFEKLKSRRWEVVSKAILDLTQMQVSEAYSFVTKFINDKRATIRKQAEIAVVSLKPEGINYFLDTTKYKISEWQQLKILDVLRTEDDFLPPPFKAWLTSTNRHVVLFALRLIKYYNQNDAKPALIELVKHKNNQIKEEAIACIKEFHVTEALDMLKLVFWKCSTDVKIAILDAIGFLGSENDIEFLRLIEKKESSFSVKSKAVSSINVIAPDSIMPSKGLINPSNFKIPADLTQKPIDVDNDGEDVLLQEESESNSEQSVASTIQIKKDENKASKEPTPKETDSIDKNITEQKDILNTTLGYEFLPIVVEDDTIIPISEISKDINEMEVYLSENQLIEKEQNTKENISSIDVHEEELAFLPIVTSNIEETSDNSINEVELQCQLSIHKIEACNEVEQKINDYSEFDNPEIMDITVVVDAHESLTNSEFELFPLSFKIEGYEIMDDKSNINKPKTQPCDSMSHQEEQVLKNVIKDLFGFEDQQSEKIESRPLLEFGNEFVELDDIEKKENLNVTPSWNQGVINNNNHDEPIPLEPEIPKAILGEEYQEEIFQYKEGSDESRQQLVEDIAKMGDERELPLLHDLLVDTNYSKEKIRIQEIINSFSEVKEKTTPKIGLKRFNVFEDLFRTCDTDAKLILLDEMMAVGDEGDIEFLEELMNNEEGLLKEKAKKTLKEVLTRLSLEEEEEASKERKEINSYHSEVHLSVDETLPEYDSLLHELEISPSNENHDMFNLTFELTDPDASEENSGLLKNEHERSSSILNQIYSISNKIIEKFNG